MFRFFFILIVTTLPLQSADAAQRKYRAGQVWSYKVRPQDSGSLLKIYTMENSKQGPIFHISIVDVRFSNPQISNVLPHLPVSKETLDKSVIALVRNAPKTFPTTTDQRIAQWRQAKGGVFTVSVAEAVDFVEQAIGGQMPQ